MQLTPRLLLSAYSEGIFPMAHEDGLIYWYDPDPRAIIPLDRFHIPRRLRRTVQQGVFEVRFDVNFTAVIEACAATSPKRETTWINQEIIEAYLELHWLGFAHSVECWLDGELVGGLYGVAVQGLFAGESMFSQVRDSSKVALVHLVERLRRGGFHLFDIQFLTDHLTTFGAIEIPAWLYRQKLKEALLIAADFDDSN